MSAALFELQGERYVPSPLCRGPWSPDESQLSDEHGPLGRARQSLLLERD